MIELYIIMNHYDDEYFETIDERSRMVVCMRVVVAVVLQAKSYKTFAVCN